MRRRRLHIDCVALVFHARMELATVLREVADAEADPRVRRRLQEIAAAFEVGVSAQDLRHEDR